MPKSSIAKKTLDSKQKRQFKQRARGRQIKKNRQITQEQAAYVTNFDRLKEKKKQLAQKMGVSREVLEQNEPKSEAEEAELEQSPLSASESESEVEMAESAESSKEEQRFWQILRKYLPHQNQSPQTPLLPALAQLLQKKQLFEVLALLAQSNNVDSSVADWASADLAEAVLRASNLGLK
jgi:hypothetical protein